MASFQTICEAMKRKPGQDFWDHKKDDKLQIDDQAMSVIQKGLNIRPDRADGNTFWHDFITVIGNNTEEAASLFGINSNVVATWSGKIRKALKEVKEENSPNDKKMTPTGD